MPSCWSTPGPPWCRPDAEPGAIANQGAGAPLSSSRLEGIERIDITGSGNNTLTDGNAGDVVNLSGWTLAGTVTHNGLSYNVHQQGSFAQLIIDNRATVIPV